MTDLVVAGGTVVTASRSFPADVAITDGRIEAVAPGLAARSPEVRIIDASAFLVLPGCIDVHTHTRLPSDQELEGLPEPPANTWKTYSRAASWSSTARWVP